MASRQEVVRLYRTILRLGSRFPSIKKDKMVEEIKAQFHRDKTLTDPQAIAKQLSIAERSVGQLRMYTDLQGANWQVQLETEPMPRPEAPEPGAPAGGDGAGAGGGDGGGDGGGAHK